jgi:hypothetical protein
LASQNPKLGESVKRLMILGVSIALSGCAVPVTKINGPDGRPAYSLKCSGMGRDRQDCLVQAGKICPQGYVVVDDSSRVNGVLVTKYAVIPASRDYLTISCK